MPFRRSAVAVAAAAACVAGAAGAQANPDPYAAVPGYDPYATRASSGTGLAFDSFDQSAVIDAPAFRPTPDYDAQQRLTAERLAEQQRATMVGPGSGRSTPMPLPLDSGAPAKGARTREVPGNASGYWNQAPLAWGTRGEQPDGPGTVVTDVESRAPYAPGMDRAETIRSGPVTIPETLATDSDAVGTGGASIPPPPDAQPGECFALVRRPALYRTAQRDFQLRPPADRLQIDPAGYVTETQTVTTRAPYEKLEVIPAHFRIVTEQVEVAPATTRYVASEPVYQAVTERVEERPARSVWKLGRGKVEKIDDATGQIMCLVEEPAVYRTVTRQVLKAPAQLREVTVPAQYRSVTRRVIDRPEQVRRVVVPAEQVTLPVNRVVQEAEVTRVPVPGQIASYGVKELVAPAEMEWRPVLCETNLTPEVIRRVQIQLTAAGFEPGPANGRMDSQTIAALNAYQRRRGLPEDRYLNLETARALGVWH